MKKENQSKIKLLKIIEILDQYSSDIKPIDTNFILEKLKENNIICDRRVLSKDIEYLNEHGYEINIIKEKGKSTQYIYNNRVFNIPELRILIDAVLSSNFISKNKSDELIDKICLIGGKENTKRIRECSINYNITKKNNEYIYYIINEIQEAITTKKKVSFLYYDYNSDIKKVFRRNGKKYYVNPITMVYTLNNYYLMCYDDYHNVINHYRIDRMMDLEITKHDIKIFDFVKNFNLEEHYSEIFGMYTGNKEKVTLEFDSSLIDIIVDKFSENIEITKQKNGKMRVIVNIQISPQFISFVLSFKDKLKVIEPVYLVNEIKKTIDSLKDLYDLK